MRKTPIRAACPHCYRTAIDAIDIDGDRRPYTGDYAVCGACGEFAVFDFTRRANVFAKPDLWDLQEIARNASAQACLARWHRLKQTVMQ